MTEASVVKKPARKASAPKAKTSPKSLSSSNLFAVFATGGKQYNVKVGNKVKIEKLSRSTSSTSSPQASSGQAEYKEGDKLTFDKVLLIDGDTSDIKLGTPFIAGATVTATLNKIARYKTIDVIKYKQKSRYFKKYGHRQPYFEIEITSIK